MSLCEAPLLDSFTKSPVELWSAYVLGSLGVWGWGLGVESLLRNKVKSYNVLHAFVEGTVVSSFGMLFLSVLGFWKVAWPLTLTGCCVGIFSLFIHWRRDSHRMGKGLLLNEFAGSKLWEWVLLFILVFTAAIQLIASPVPIGDTTAIWGFHAKVLTCFPLFKSSFVLEKIWAGTHPEYPLYLSYMHALFFSLADSFRDDWVKIWQAVFLICGVLIGYFEIKRHLRRLAAFTAVTALMAVVGGTGGPAELCSRLFVWLICISFFESRPLEATVLFAGFLIY